MYKDDPGVYYHENGTVADKALAEQAGFPVDEHYRERRKRELLAHHRERIDRLMQRSAAEIEVLIDQELAGPNGQEATAPAPERTEPAPPVAEEPAATGGRKKKS
jgi:hypothetical protein